MQLNILLCQFLCFSSLTIFTRSTNICVYSREGKDTGVCPNITLCQHVQLDNMTMFINGNNELVVHICSNISMTNVTKFLGLTSVTIKGMNGISYLHCRNEEAGFHFENVSYVEILNISINQCGFEKSINELDLTFISSICMINCSNISVTNVTIQKSSGIGLILINNNNIAITNCAFNENKLSQKNSTLGGGLYIVSTRNNSVSIIENCNFTNNRASLNSNNSEIHLAQGGGLSIYFRAEADDINITIKNCQFHNNRAYYGGAINVFYLEHSSKDITVSIDHSNFTANSAVSNGGALYVRDNNNMTQNGFHLSDCRFSHNSADFAGGGIYLLVSPKHLKIEKQLKFTNCLWVDNQAKYGAAVHIVPQKFWIFIRSGYLPVPLFENCIFMNNKIITGKRNDNTHTLSTKTNNGNGVFLANKIKVTIQGRTEFINNSGSAIYLVSSTLHIDSNSDLIFSGNEGYQGGAINMQGFSFIHVKDETVIVFKNNTALTKGGAIFQNIYPDSACFIEYVGYMSNVGERNTSLHFMSNSVGNHINPRGSSMFLSSAIPCIRKYPESENIVDALNHIGSFHIDIKEISTPGSNFTMQPYGLPHRAIPGKEFNLGIKLIDDTKSEVSPYVYRVEVKPFPGSNVHIDSVYTYVSNNKIKLSGSPNNSAEIKIKLTNSQTVQLSFIITLEQCPPGYVLFENSHCVCSANNINTRYTGITLCQQSTLQANLIRGYWAGYNNKTISADNFLTGNCPYKFCKPQYHNKTFLLPESARLLDNLNDLICSENRHGKLCGLCKNGTSVFYHTPSYDCYTNNRACDWGILLFIISEIIPVTVMLLIVILFDIQLTAGVLNSFILYFQMFDILHINGGSFIKFEHSTNVMLDVLNFILRIFNLKFFAVKEMSFCLFRGANTLHIIAFDYVTVIYALILVLFTVLIMSPYCNTINRCLCRIKGRKTQGSKSIIHGLSGFLVLCYARSTLVCIQLITRTVLHYKGHERQESVSHYNGDVEYLSGEHLKYVIPAIFALFFMTIFLPILLITYPLCYRVFALFRIQESKYETFLCKIIPLEKIKPFLDSFQGTFKDKYRFFSGLYFIYRLLLMLTFSLISTYTMIYFYIEVQFIIILGVHAWIQPYKKKWHNRLDIFIFAVLSVLNGITISNFQRTFSPINHQASIQVFSFIQVMLSYSPLAVVIGYLFMIVWRQARKYRFKRRSQSHGDSQDKATLFSLTDTERELESHHDDLSYHEISRIS